MDVAQDTSTATVVEAPPAKADLRSILQNGTDGFAATLKWRLEGRSVGLMSKYLGLCHPQIGLLTAPSGCSNKSNLELNLKFR